MSGLAGNRVEKLFTVLTEYSQRSKDSAVLDGVKIRLDRFAKLSFQDAAARSETEKLCE